MGEGRGEELRAAGPEGVSLEVERLQIGALLEELREDLEGDVGQFVEGEVEVSQQLHRDGFTFSCVYRAEVRRMRSRSVSLLEKFSLSLPRKTRSR